MSKRTSLINSLKHSHTQTGKGGGGTRDRAKFVFKGFAAIMFERGFQIANVRQIKPKHLQAYVEVRLARGIQKRTLQSDVSALRRAIKLAGKEKMLHEPNIRNKALGLTGASRKGTGRAATPEEFQAFLDRAFGLGRPGDAAAAMMQWHFGLRAKEATSLETPILERMKVEMLKGSAVQVTRGTKGGRMRFTSVADWEASLRALEFALTTAKSQGGFLIVSHAEIRGKTALVRYKNLVKSFGLRTHSFRYSFAQARIRRYIECGFGSAEAFSATAVDLGHGDGRGKYVKSVYGRDHIERERAEAAAKKAGSLPPRAAPSPVTLSQPPGLQAAMAIAVASSCNG